MKSILFACFLVGCMTGPERHPGRDNAFEVVCYNGITDCAVDALKICPHGYEVLLTSARAEGRAGDDSSAIRVVQSVVCR